MDECETLLTTDACTMPAGERPARLAEFDSLFTTAVRRVERLGDTVRLHLAGDAGLAGQVRDLTDREAACCSFFTFTIHGGTGSGSGDLTLDVTVPPAYRSVADAFAARARELSS